MRKIMGILIVAGAAMFLSFNGCGGEKQAAGNSKVVKEAEQEEPEHSDSALSEETGYVFPKSYEREAGNVKFHTIVEVPEELAAKKLRAVSARQQIPDAGKVKNALLKNNNISEELQDYYTDNHGNKVKAYYIHGEHGEILNIGNDIMFGSLLSSYVTNAFRLSNNANSEKFSQDLELGFSSREDALKEIVKTLEQMGCQLGEIEYHCYALDHETLQKEEYAEDMDGNIDKSVYKEKWTQEDDCYYFCIRQKVQGIPEYHPYADVFKSAQDENAPIQIIYSVNGIEKLEIDKAFSFQEEGEELELVPFEQAAEAVEQKFTQIITDAQYQVVSAKLFYMPEYQKEYLYQMVPVWCFAVEETANEVQNRLEVFVNAQTGKELPMEDKY